MRININIFSSHIHIHISLPTCIQAEQTHTHVSCIHTYIYTSKHIVGVHVRMYLFSHAHYYIGWACSCDSCGHAREPELSRCELQKRTLRRWDKHTQTYGLKKLEVFMQTETEYLPAFSLQLNVGPMALNYLVESCLGLVYKCFI
jgi:hypothetical protein